MLNKLREKLGGKTQLGGQDNWQLTAMEILHDEIVGIRDELKKSVTKEDIKELPSKEYVKLNVEKVRKWIAIGAAGTLVSIIGALYLGFLYLGRPLIEKLIEVIANN